MFHTSQPITSVLVAFLIVTLALALVGMAPALATLWGAVTAALLYVDRQQSRRSDEL